MATPTIISGSTKNPQPVPPDRPISALAAPDLVSILIPCLGMLEYTKLCVPSLLRHSRPPIEVIFLDIGSLDGTAEYLAGVQATAQFRIEIVSTPTDLGIPETIRAALSQARGQYIVLLNNDTIVTPHWLQHLISLADHSPTVGMVGPMSNYAAPTQLVESVPYRIGKKRLMGGNPWDVDVEAIHRFAQEFTNANAKKWLMTDYLGGFCLLIKRHVLERLIPELHPFNDLSLFDSYILSTKAHQAGFQLACCRDLFVHHFGTRTFAHGAPAKTQEQLQTPG